jgi:osmotically-inducible protein OsmY
MNDRELQQHVTNALAWEPSINDKDIAVSAEGGVVALRGDVGTFSERAAAERVALRVYGVKAVANDLNVKLGHDQQHSDAEIAQAALSALKWDSRVPDEKITLVVSNGWITLKGVVAWEFQRASALTAVRNLAGVRGVTNLITLETRVQVQDVKAKIEDALKRSAEVDARRVNVAAADGKVTLSGNVHSWFEKEEARRAAWAAPGVKDVDDRIQVVP